MFEISAFSDSKLLCCFTVIFRFNLIHRYDVVSNIIANNIFLLIFYVNIFLETCVARQPDLTSSLDSAGYEAHEGKS